MCGVDDTTLNSKPINICFGLQKTLIDKYSVSAQLKILLPVDEYQANYDDVKTQLFGDCFVIDVVVMLFY